MGLFNKKKEAMAKPNSQALPNLPKLPDFPRLTDDSPEPISRLPRYPQNSFGTKFSQNSIKEAVTGDEEDDELLADDFADSERDMDDMRMMQEPLKRPRTEEMGMSPRGMPMRRTTTEPVFIRIDKFEEAMRIFNETKKKISEIERVLEDIKSIKEKEDRELGIWESEVKAMKSQIEKIDQDIFSKI
jgi:hypothetical protein